MIRGISSGFYTVTRALQASQWAMQLHLENIANANDPNYTRRTLENRVDPFGRLPEVVRMRDLFIDFQYRRAQSSAGYASIRADLMARVEDIFGDPIEGGLAQAIDRFFDAFKAVSEDPADEVLRMEAIEAGRRFVQHIHEAMSQLTLIKGQINERIEGVVTQINAHLKNLQNLNSRIASMVGSSEMAADLMDERDRVLDELARLTGARATYLADGTVRVMIGSVPAVDGTAINLLEVVQGENGPMVRWQDFAVPQFAGHGELAALLDMRDGDLNHVIAEVDKLAKNVAREVNNIHRKGYDLDGQTGRDFFLIQDDVPGGVYVHPDLTLRGIAAAGSADGWRADGTNADKIYQLSYGMWPAYADTYTWEDTSSPENPVKTLELGRDLSASFLHTWQTEEPVVDENGDPVLDAEGNPVTQTVDHEVRMRGTWRQNVDGSVTVTFTEQWDADAGDWVPLDPPVVAQYRRENQQLAAVGGEVYQAGNPDLIDKSSSPTTWYRNLVGLIGSRGKAAIHDNEIAEAHIQAAQEQRSSKFGVSIDEEIALMTAEQKAFAAVARVLTVLDEMLQTLINAVS